MEAKVDLALPEEYRPARVIGGEPAEEGGYGQLERGWQIRMEDGLWLSITRVDSLYDTARVHPDVTRLHLEDGTHTVHWSNEEVIMSRRLVDPLPAAPSPLLVEVNPATSTIAFY